MAAVEWERDCQVSVLNSRAPDKGRKRRSRIESCRKGHRMEVCTISRENRWLHFFFFLNIDDLAMFI